MFCILNSSPNKYALMEYLMPNDYGRSANEKEAIALFNSEQNFEFRSSVSWGYEAK